MGHTGRVLFLTLFVLSFSAQAEKFKIAKSTSTLIIRLKHDLSGELDLESRGGVHGIIDIDVENKNFSGDGIIFDVDSVSSLISVRAYRAGTSLASTSKLRCTHSS